jgi:transposase-like protein
VARQGPHRVFTEEFKRRAVERMDTAEKIEDLAGELGIRRNLLYKWEAKLKGKAAAGKPRPAGAARTDSEAEQILRSENGELREALAKRALAVDFFKGALHKVEARRQSSSGDTASTSKSAK